jgi:hypothetical protein
VCNSASPGSARRLTCIRLQARTLQLLVRLLELPHNVDYLLASGPLLPGFARAALAALDVANSLEPDDPGLRAAGGEAACRLSALLQVLVCVLEHDAANGSAVQMQEELVRPQLQLHAQAVDHAALFCVDQMHGTP